MTSPKLKPVLTNSQKPSPQSRFNKFLTRNIKVDNNNELVFQKICMKRLYLTTITDHREKDWGSREIVYRPFKNNKLFRTLKNIEIPCINKSYVSENLKMSRNLKQFTLSPIAEGITIDKLPSYLKRLPKSTQSISFEFPVHDSAPRKNFSNVAKSLRYLQKLESFDRFYYLGEHTDRNGIQNEIQAYSQSVSRLKKRKRIGYYFSYDEAFGFQRLMRRGVALYSGITELRMRLSSFSFPDYVRMMPYFDYEDSVESESSIDFDDMIPQEEYMYGIIQDEIRQRDEKENNEDLYNFEDDERLTIFDQNFAASCQMREEIKPFYRFELFPNLKMLEIVLEDHLYPLGPFVVDGFKSLQNLEELEIDIMCRSVGTGYIFQGFLELPSLKKFSLQISFIKNEEWGILTKFLASQNQLEYLLLRLSCPTSSQERYIQQNYYLESVIKTLHNKKSLTSLHIKSIGWSLEALSKGLSYLSNFENQLKSFSFEASDDTIFSTQKVWKRVEGICNFIKNQKGSLTKLKADLPIALEDRIVNEIAEAISTLSQLKKFEFSVNRKSLHGVDFLTQYFQQELQVEIPKSSRKKLKASESWSPNLAKYLKRLQNLEDFELGFDISFSQTGDWVADVFRTFPSLEKLRHLKFRTQSLRKLEKLIGPHVIAPILKEMKNIREITVYNFGEHRSSDENSPSLSEFIYHKNQSQALRCDLMF